MTKEGPDNANYPGHAHLPHQSLGGFATYDAVYGWPYNACVLGDLCPVVQETLCSHPFCPVSPSTISVVDSGQILLPS